MFPPHTLHTLHNIGKHLALSVLNDFMTSWLQLVPQPGAAKLRWEAILDKTCSKFSKVRWWSRWEIMQERALNFSELPKFLADLDSDGVGDATTKKMIEIMTNNKDELELELAAVMSCERLCTATYRLEVDGLELLLTHRTFEALRIFGRTLGTHSSNLPTLGAYKPCNVACNKHSPCYKLRYLVTSYLVTLTSHITSTGLQALGYKGGLQPLVTPLLAVS